MEIKNTKEMRNYYEQYKSVPWWQTHLSDCYGRWSQAKEQAYQYCVDLMESLNGWGLKITGYCTNFFSVGFMYEQEGKTYFARITASYDRACEIKEG